MGSVAVFFPVPRARREEPFWEACHSLCVWCGSRTSDVGTHLCARRGDGPSSQTHQRFFYHAPPVGSQSTESRSDSGSEVGSEGLSGDSVLSSSSAPTAAATSNAAPPTPTRGGVPPSRQTDIGTTVIAPSSSSRSPPSPALVPAVVRQPCSTTSTAKPPSAPLAVPQQSAAPSTATSPSAPVAVQGQSLTASTVQSSSSVPLTSQPQVSASLPPQRQPLASNTPFPGIQPSSPVSPLHGGFLRLEVIDGKLFVPDPSALRSVVICNHCPMLSRDCWCRNGGSLPLLPPPFSFLFSLQSLVLERKSTLFAPSRVDVFGAAQ